MKQMAMEKGLYAHVVKLCCKYLKFVETDKKKDESKFKFQGQSARSQQWFDLDFDWIEVEFSTRETYFYKNFFQSHDNKQYINTLILFQVPIGNEKSVE